jgi:DNA-binding transcriptional regulator GbsR (MarR family)
MSWRTHKPVLTLSPLEKKMNAHWEGVSCFFGWSKVTALVANTLALRDGPMTREELATLLGRSHTSLLAALKEALQFGAVKSSRHPHSRSDYFETAIPDELHGIGWLSWRLNHRLHYLIAPSVRLYREVLCQRELFSPTIAKRLDNLYESFSMEQEILRAFAALSDERKLELLTKMLEWCHEVDKKDRQIPASEPLEESFSKEKR